MPKREHSSTTSSSSTDSQSKSSPSALTKDDKGNDDTVTIKRLKLENKELNEKFNNLKKELNSTKEQLNTTMEQLKKKEEEEEEEEGNKTSFRCCSHIDEEGWTTKLSPCSFLGGEMCNAYHCTFADPSGINVNWCEEPVTEIAYYGSIGYQCECMLSFKPLCEYKFMILCADCEEEKFNPKICHSCGMKESECDGDLDGEGICQECIEACQSCGMKESECDGVLDLDREGICQECIKAIKKDKEEAK